ncbi:hypothetical protein [Orenia metallireducens]|jgi:F0F1-type ATP synthase membrane subunit b/b'|uniref:hypothetical protein n=1 Tax=Orenia metallireducens TaxID=1413210 RepID=UPI00159F25DE|nr:hypothetical protein [Orenia metallireducens]
MGWILFILLLIFLWLLKKHPTNSNFKVFDNYSYYISKYLDVNKKDNDRDKGQDN